MADKVKIWFDAKADYLEVRFSDAAGHMKETRHDAVMERVDSKGRVIGFSGRVLSGDEKTAKYVNSPETPIFTKGKVIYGLDKSKRTVLEAGEPDA